MPKANEVNEMFGRIAPRYDLANRVMSAGSDLRWRRRLVRAVVERQPRSVLDLATGSGDVAFALAAALPPEVPITGGDFCVPMLEQAEARKRAQAAPVNRVVFEPADGLALPYPDASFDAVTISFGLRNFADRARGLAEIRRVLTPRGSLFVLEFSQPDAWLRPAYYLYMKRIAPRISGFITGVPAAYDYLCSSIESFPGRDGLTAEMHAAGFTRVAAEPMGFGIVALHQAVTSDR